MNNKNKEKIVMEGEVIKTLPSAQFEVELEGGKEVRAYLSGKMMMNRINVMPGDRVVVEMSPYDLTKGRITRRM
jgi:translation initiation factor IF-1